MAMIEVNFNCPNCGQNVDAPAEMAGQTVDCPACQQPLTIPAPVQSAPSALAAPAPAPVEPAPVAASAPAAPQAPAKPGLRKPAAVVAPRPQPAAPAPRPAAVARPAISLPPKGPAGRISSVPTPTAAAPTAAAAAGVPIVKRLAEPLYQVRGWMKFLGVLLIITGVIQALTIVGLMWLWMGLLLNSAANAVREAYEKDREAPLALAQQKLRTLIKVMGIYSVITMVVTFILLIVLLLAGGTIFAALSGSGTPSPAPSPVFPPPG
jgi:hypothetical protein